MILSIYWPVVFSIGFILFLHIETYVFPVVCCFNFLYVFFFIELLVYIDL